MHLCDVLLLEDTNFLPHVPIRQRHVPTASDSDTDDSIHNVQWEEAVHLSIDGSSHPNPSFNANILANEESTSNVAHT